MEQQSAAELIEDLKLRLEGIEVLLSTPDRSRAKERRQFDTAPLPLDWVCQHLPSVSQPPYLQQRGSYRPVVDDLLNLFVHPIRSAPGQIRVKPSQKVISSEANASLFDLTSRRIRALELNGRMGSLESYFCQYGRGADYERAVGGTVNNNLHVAHLKILLLQDRVPSSEEWADFHGAWPKVVTSDLRTKFYPARGEIRAFVSDKDEFRSLVGSIVHSLISHQSNHLRRLAPFGTVYPRRGKHLLQEQHHVGEEDTFALLLGDISSFTASLKNGWVLLIGVLLSLEEGGKEYHLVVDVKGSLLEMSVYEVLRVFLYLASGVVVRDEDEEFTSIGGMLGISGVDTLMKVTFALYLRALCQSPSRGVKLLSPKVGGDDFILRLCIRKSFAHSLEEWYIYLREQIMRYMGYLKEFCSIVVPLPPYDQITAERYCKKRLRIRSTVDGGYRSIKIQSQWNYPMYSAYLAPLTAGAKLSSSEFWQTTRNVPYVPERETLRSIAFALSPRPDSDINPCRRARLACIDVWLEQGCTLGALRVLSSVPPISDSLGNIYRDLPEDRMSYVDSRRLKRQRVSVEGKVTTIISTPETVVRPPLDQVDSLPDRSVEVPKGLAETVHRVVGMINHFKL